MVVGRRRVAAASDVATRRLPDASPPPRRVHASGCARGFLDLGAGVNGRGWFLASLDRWSYSIMIPDFSKGESTFFFPSSESWSHRDFYEIALEEKRLAVRVSSSTR